MLPRRGHLRSPSSILYFQHPQKLSAELILRGATVITGTATSQIRDSTLDGLGRRRRKRPWAFYSFLQTCFLQILYCEHHILKNRFVDLTGTALPKNLSSSSLTATDLERVLNQKRHNQTLYFAASFIHLGLRIRNIANTSIKLK